MALPNFGQMKDMYQLQKKAKQLQKELKDLEIEARSSDGIVTVVVNGEMKIVSIDIAAEYMTGENKNHVQNAVKDALTQAMARAQSESASRMQPLLKDLKLPGM